MLVIHEAQGAAMRVKRHVGSTRGIRHNKTGRRSTFVASSFCVYSSFNLCSMGSGALMPMCAASYSRWPDFFSEGHTPSSRAPLVADGVIFLVRDTKSSLVCVFFLGACLLRGSVGGMLVGGGACG